MEAEQYYGLKITNAVFLDAADRLQLTFENGKRVYISDCASLCCEARYMTTDDDVAVLVGGALRRIEVKEGPSEHIDKWEEHDTCFVEVGTDDAHVVLTTHNKHNGYYGGFNVMVREET